MPIDNLKFPGISWRYVSNLATTFLSQSVSAISIFLLTPVLSQNLGDENFGRYGVLLSVIIFSSVFDFGLNIGLLRRLIHNKSESVPLINSLFFFFLLLFVTSVPVFYLLYHTGIVTVKADFFYYSFFTGLLVTQNILAVLFDAIIQTANKIFIGKIARIIKISIEFAGLYFFCRMGSVTLLLLVSSLVNFGYIYALFLLSRKEVNYRISVDFFNRSMLWSHMRYSFWYFQNAIAGVLVLNAQVIMIGSVMGPAVVGRYFLVVRFFDIIRTGLTNFVQVLFPALAAIEARGNWNQIRDYYFRVLKRIAILSVISWLLLITIGKYIFIYWSRHSDPEILHLFKVFAVFIVLIVIDNVSVVFLGALKLNRLETIVAMVQGIFGLTLGYFLLKTYGITGVAMASIAALVMTNLFFNPLYLLRNIRHKTRSNAT
ncbi:MAG: hypothetical protein JWN76_943 [Chitinophagaceae bacterium]|nr:hypothetical protein [Chitinophagaceae bacterium]